MLKKFIVYIGKDHVIKKIFFTIIYNCYSNNYNFVINYKMKSLLLLASAAVAALAVPHHTTFVSQKKIIQVINVESNLYTQSILEN